MKTLLSVSVLCAFASLSVFAASAPVFSSNPTASPNPAFIGQLVSLNASATSANALTYTWNFGDGMTGSGSSVTHRFTFIAQTYTVTVTASDGTLSTQATVTLTTIAPVVGLGVDSDGDGFSDQFELDVGTDPNDIKSTPLNGAPAIPGSVKSITDEKMDLQVKTGAKPKGSLSLSCSLLNATRPSAGTSGQKVYVHLSLFSFDGSRVSRASVGFGYVLNSKGTSATSPTGSIKYAFKSEQPGKANAAMGRNTPLVKVRVAEKNLQELERFVSSYPGTSGVPVSVRITFTSGGATYETTGSGVFKSTSDTAGTLSQLTIK